MPVLLLLALSLSADAADPNCEPAEPAVESLRTAVQGVQRVMNPGQIGTRDVIYEFIAHHLAYKDSFSSAEEALLRGWGLDPDPVHYRGRNGMSVMLFEPLPESSAAPVIAFRGTQPSEFSDLMTDVDKEIGKTQYDSNEQLIGLLFDRLKQPADLVGHSLGAALAQRAAVEHWRDVRSVYGYQAPAVSADTAQRFQALPKRPPVRYHLSSWDLVDLGGEQHLDGEFFVHRPRTNSDPLTAHTDYLLQSPQYELLGELAGVDRDKMEQLAPGSVKDLTAVHEVEYHTQYHRPIRKSLLEDQRQIVATGVDAGEWIGGKIWKWLIGR